MKFATAIRHSDNLYTVTYSGSQDMDVNVPRRYLETLVNSGYTVEVDQHNYRFEGEPKMYKMESE